MKLRQASFFIVAIIVNLFLLSCSWGRQATGVVVWATASSQIDNGTIVWVWEESRIRGVSKIQAETDFRTIELDSWRILSFATENQARDFSVSFQPWRYTWAKATTQGAPIRQEPEQTAQKIYKLRYGEEVKVLNKAPEKSQEKNAGGFWIEVLTQSGHQGWCFDQLLELVERKPHQPEEVTQTQQKDENLLTLLKTSWYPEEFKLMIDQQRINLDVFKADAGLRLIENTQTFQLIWPKELSLETRSTNLEATDFFVDEHYNLTWQSVFKSNDFTYHFAGKEGLSIQLMDSQLRRISVRFTQEGQGKEFALVRLTHPVDEFMSKELALRQEKLQELIAYGSVLASPTYGTLTINSEGTFDWQGFDALTPPYGTVLPAETPSTGTVVFDWFKANSLVGDYKILRLQFGDSANPSLVFLWRFLKEGVQMIPVHKADLNADQHTVLRASRLGISLFFTYQNE